MQVTVKTAIELTFKDLKVGQLFVLKAQATSGFIDKVGLYLKDDETGPDQQGICLVTPLGKTSAPVTYFVTAGHRCAFGADTKVLVATIEHITVTDN